MAIKWRPSSTVHQLHEQENPSAPEPFGASTRRARASWRSKAFGFTVLALIASAGANWLLYDEITTMRNFGKHVGMILVDPRGNEFFGCSIVGARGANKGGGQYSECK